MLSSDLSPHSFWRPCHFLPVQQLGCVHVWVFSRWGMSSHAQEGVMVTKQAWCHHGQVYALLQGSLPIWGLQADSESQLPTLSSLNRFCLTRDGLLSFADRVRQRSHKKSQSPCCPNAWGTQRVTAYCFSACTLQLYDMSRDSGVSLFHSSAREQRVAVARGCFWTQQC